MKIKELMIPVAEYTTVQGDATLADVFVALDKAGHRDVLVLDDKGEFLGTLTMYDVLLSLEPNYKKLLGKDSNSDTLTHKYVAEMFKEFDLWGDSLKNLCTKRSSLLASEVMYTPAEGEYLDLDDDLETGIHRFVVGMHQPLIVRKCKDVVGVLRLHDVFEVIKKHMIECSI